MLAMVLAQGTQSPVVDDEQVYPGIAGQEPPVASIGPGEGEVLEERRGADV